MTDDNNKTCTVLISVNGEVDCGKACHKNAYHITQWTKWSKLCHD